MKMFGNFIRPLVVFLTVIHAVNAIRFEVEIEDIFDVDSIFMDGFTTGLTLRWKGEKLEDHDCQTPQISSPETEDAFVTI